MFGRYLGCVSHPQPDQPQGQQSAQVSAALRWRHLVRWKWVGSFHGSLGSVVSLGFYSSVSKFVPTARPTVAAIWVRTYYEHSYHGKRGFAMAGNLKKFVNPRFIKTIDLVLMKAC